MVDYSYIDENEKSKVNPIVKVFGYMFLGLLVSAGISFGTYYGLVNASISADVYMGMLIASSIGIFIVCLISQIFLIKNKAKGGLVAYIIYTILMGVLLSSLLLMYSIKYLAFTFICSGLMFGAMALYGLLAKHKATNLGMFGIGLLFGVITLSIVNIIIHSAALDWAISLIGLAAMLAITAWDVNRAKNIGDDKSMIIYMALQLYTDFVYIFIRLVAIFARERR